MALLCITYCTSGLPAVSRTGGRHVLSLVTVFAIMDTNVGGVEESLSAPVKDKRHGMIDDHFSLLHKRTMWE